MDNEIDLLCFKTQLLFTEITMNGMIAENKQREIEGKSMAYIDEDFQKIIKAHNIEVKKLVDNINKLMNDHK